MEEMDRQQGGRVPVSRRSVLKSGAVATTGSALVGGVVRAGDPRRETATVMTQNLYLGGSLVSALRAETDEEFRESVDEIYQNVLESRFDVRAGRLADVVAEHEPDLLGLQEVSRFVKTGDGESTDLDYLRTLLAELDDRGLPYATAATVTNVDDEFPATGSGENYRVRFVDRDVVLAHEDCRTSDPTASDFWIHEVGMPVTRGYCGVTVDESFTFVNTHLALASNPFVQVTQALELVRRFDDAPTVLVGDLNSAPDDSERLAYDVLTDRGDYMDAYATANPDEEGHTCCQHPDLANETSSLDRRIDHVLTRGGIEPNWARRVGHEADDRVDGLWPSDHAGVVAEVERP